MFQTFVSIIDIQSWWEVPSIAHFCSLFRAAFNLLDFDIEELEEALLNDGTEDCGSQLLQELIVRLLSGCLGTNDISTSNYQMFLRRVFRQKCQEYNQRNPFNSDIDFQFLPLRTKVEILNTLTQFRLDADDVPELTKNLEADSLRVEPLGYDNNESAYWYFYGTRLYREDFRDLNAKVNQKRSNKIQNSPIVDLAQPIWQVVCFTEQDWVQLTSKFKNSSSKAEKALHRSLTENFLPEIPRLFQEKERLQRKRLLELQPRRTSSRVQKLGEQEIENIQRETCNNNESLEIFDLDENKVIRTGSIRDFDPSTPLRIPNTSTKLNRATGKSTELLPIGLDEPKSTTMPTPSRVGRQTNNSLACATGQIVIQPLAPARTTKKKMKTSQIFRQTDEDLQTGMYKILEYIKNHEDAWPFIEPVEEEYAPNYYTVVRKPMDLNRMEEKLDTGEYLTFAKFSADFKLIVDNCRLYNGSKNEYTQMINDLQMEFEKATKRYLDQVCSSDEEIAVEFEVAKDKKLPDVESLKKTKRHGRKRKITGESLKEKLEKDDYDSVPSVSPSPPPDKRKKSLYFKNNHVKHLCKKKTKNGEIKIEKKKRGRKKKNELKMKMKMKKRRAMKKHKKRNGTIQNEFLDAPSELYEKVERPASHAKVLKKRGRKRKHNIDGESQSNESSKLFEDLDKLSNKLGRDEKSDKSQSSLKIKEKSTKLSKIEKNKEKIKKKKYDEPTNEKKTKKKSKNFEKSDIGEFSVDDKFSSTYFNKAAPVSLAETIEKLKQKSGMFKEEKQNAESCPKSKLDDKFEFKALDNESDDEKLSKRTGKKQKSVTKPKTGVIKNAAAIEALAIATEQTLKDFNKWLDDDSPKAQEFDRRSETSSPVINTEELEMATSKLEADYKKNAAEKREKLQQEQQQTLETETPLTTVGTPFPVATSTFKDVSIRKRTGTFNKDANKIPQKRREVQRTIQRLQPGKSKGNLIGNIQSIKNDENSVRNSNGLIKKDGKISLTKHTSSDNSAPKLSLGTVLDSFGQQHSFGNEPSRDNMMSCKKLDATLKDDVETGTEPSKELVCPVEATDKDSTLVTAVEKPKINQENVTPNLSAWFKAFGAPKLPGSGVLKKKEGEFNEQQIVSPTAVDEKNKLIDEEMTSTSTLVATSTNLPATPGTVMGGDPSPPQPIARARKASTGSTVSERSSFSQDNTDPLDSPRLSVDERLGYPGPYPSPLHRSPHDSSPIIASPRDREDRMLQYPQINSAIRVGFYQDTAKSSPEKSCSPRDQPKSPYSIPYPAHHVYVPPQTPGYTYTNNSAYSSPHSPSVSSSSIVNNHLSMAQPLSPYTKSDEVLTAKHPDLPPSYANQQLKNLEGNDDADSMRNSVNMDIPSVTGVARISSITGVSPMSNVVNVSETSHSNEYTRNGGNFSTVSSRLSHMLDERDYQNSSRDFVNEQLRMFATHETQFSERNCVKDTIINRLKQPDQIRGLNLDASPTPLSAVSCKSIKTIDLTGPDYDGPSSYNLANKNNDQDSMTGMPGLTELSNITSNLHTASGNINENASCLTNIVANMTGNGGDNLSSGQACNMLNQNIHRRLTDLRIPNIDTPLSQSSLTYQNLPFSMPSTSATNIGAYGASGLNVHHSSSGNLANISHIVDRYQTDHPEHRLMTTLSIPTTYYSDKSLYAKSPMLYSQPELSSQTNYMIDTSGNSFNYPQLPKNQQQNYQQQVAIPEKRPRKQSRKKEECQLENKQAFPTYPGLKVPGVANDTIKTAALSNAFNFGTPGMLNPNEVLEKNSNFGFLDDYRNPTNYYMMAAAHQAAAASLSAAVGIEMNNASSEKPSRISNANNTNSNAYLAQPRSNGSPAATYPANYPFNLNPQSSLLDPSSSLYQQYLQRHQQDLLRHSTVTGLLNAAVASSNYPPGYSPLGAIRQPFDRSWL